MEPIEEKKHNYYYYHFLTPNQTKEFEYWRYYGENLLIGNPKEYAPTPKQKRLNLSSAKSDDLPTIEEENENENE